MPFTYRGAVQSLTCLLHICGSRAGGLRPAAALVLVGHAATLSEPNSSDDLSYGAHWQVGSRAQLRAAGWPGRAQVMFLCSCMFKQLSVRYYDFGSTSCATYELQVTACEQRLCQIKL
jgi:hypothetical protein